MPSPTSTMVPTPATSAPSSKPEISLRMIEVISSDRIAIGVLSKPSFEPSGVYQASAEPLQAAAHARVVEPIADAHGDPADERLVDHLVHIDLVAGHPPQPLLDGRTL